MNQYDDTYQAIRRIVLPSGRTIEVVRTEKPDTPPRELHLCPACTSDLVQRVSCVENAQGRWDLTLECPNCGRRESGSYSRQQNTALDVRDDEGLAAMIEDLEQLSEANIEEAIFRFSAALDCGLILPEDF